MKTMKRINNFNKSYITVQVDSVDGEKILNYLWNKNVNVKNVKRNNAFSLTLEILVSDYSHLEDGVRKVKGKVKILHRRGINFFYIKLSSRKLLIVGIAVFFFILYYCGRFIWSVDIATNKYLAPLEVRNILKGYGIMVGSKKDKIDVLKLEENLVTDIDEIMWVKVRIEGSRLTVDIVERQEEPDAKGKEYTGDLVAKKSGVINRIYTSAGTPVKTPGTVVNQGELIVKGQEGKEGMEFSVKAEGRIYATTFYEEIIKVPLSTTEKRRTGNKQVRYGLNVNNNKIYLKKSLNNYGTCDKIEENWGIFIKETYYETKEVEEETNTEIVIKELQNKITLNLDRGVKILDVTPEVKKQDEQYEIRVLFTVEEDIAESQAVTTELEKKDESPET
jgi:similar to stage IV sporulation protein